MGKLVGWIGWPATLFLGWQMTPAFDHTNSILGIPQDWILQKLLEAAEKLFGGILAEGKLRRIRYHSSGFPSFFATIGRNSDSLKSV